MGNSEVFIHEKAICDSKQLGAGTRVWGFSHVLGEARVGKNCNIGEHVFIENDVQIGDGCTIKNGVAIWDAVTLEDNVFIGPYVVFTNDLKPRAFLKRGGSHYLKTTLKKGVSIGANSTLVCGITIGEFAMIGAGSVVTKNVSAHSLVLGNPGRIVGRVCYCGERLTEKDYCKQCKCVLAENTMEVTQRLFSIHNNA